jgi:hypothetical protein
MNKEQERSSGAPAPDALAQTPCPREEELFRKGAAGAEGHGGALVGANGGQHEP